MANVRKALTGKRVYRMSSHAPTRGNVNPAGYVQREMRNRAKKGMPATSNRDKHKFANGHDNRKSKVGGDGKSDTRSGLAAQALARAIGDKMYTSTASNLGSAVLGPGYVRPPALQTPTGLASQAANAAVRAGSTTKIGSAPKPAVKPAVKPPGISINAQGLLELPFDYNAGMAVLDQQRQANDALLNLNQQGQQQALTFGQNMRNAALAYQQQRRSTLNNNAGRGVAFGSGHGLAVANDATTYNNQVGDLNSGNTAFMNQILAQRQQIQQAFQDFLKQSALDRANNLSGQLGTLGYGK